MKAKLFVVLMFLLTGLHCTAGDIALLVPLKEEVTQAVDKVQQDMGQYIKEYFVYFMNITSGDAYAIDVALVPVALVGDLLYDKVYTISGYFKYNGVTVIVFGNVTEPFLEKTDETMNFAKPVVKTTPGGLPYIPPIIDLYEWKFEYTNTLSFLKVAFFSFLSAKK